MSTRLLVKNVRLAFGQGLYNKSKPSKDPNAKEKFRANFLLVRNHPQLAEIQKIIKAEAQAKFGAKWETIYKAADAQAKICLRDGDLKSDFEGFADHWFISASAFSRPTVFNADGNPIDESSGIVYSGCYVHAIINFKAFDNVSKGVAAEIAGVKYAGEGDAFSGGKVASAEEFGDEIAAPAEEDPLTK